MSINLNLLYLSLLLMQNQDEESYDHSMAILTVNRYECQENAVFIDFTKEEIISNLENYKTLNIYHRTALSKNIQSIRQICKESPCYPTFLVELAQDCEQIQMELIDFLQQFFIKQSVGISYDIQYIEPLKYLIKHAHLEIKEESCTLLAQIIHRMSAKQRTETINLALQLQNNPHDQSKVIALQLMAKLAPDLSPSEVESYFTNHYTTMYNSQSIRIKKEVLHNLSALATGVSPEFFDKQIIQKFYMIKCRQHMFTIRKACVQILPALMTLSKSKKDILSTVLFNFTIDDHKCVRTGAFKILPQFLANFPPSNSIGKLLSLYISLIDNDINHFVNRENQIISKVGFYFPGIVRAFGVAKWNSFKGLFQRLLHFKSDEVKLPIAASLHEICKIIGPSIAKEIMLEAILSLLKQPSQMLKQIAVSHLSDFVQIFPNQTRQNLIDIFLVFQNDPKQWRTRYKIALQLSHLAKIYQTEAVVKYIFPIALKLCNDIAAEVRLEAASHMYDVISKFNQHEQYQSMALLTIRELGSSNRYIQRQMFAFMTRTLYKLKLFGQLLMEMVLRLASDKVNLVRLTLVLSIEQIIKTDPQHHQLFQKAIDILKKDEDEDITDHFL